MLSRIYNKYWIRKKTLYKVISFKDLRVCIECWFFKTTLRMMATSSFFQSLSLTHQFTSIKFVQFSWNQAWWNTFPLLICKISCNNHNYHKVLHKACIKFHFSWAIRSRIGYLLLILFSNRVLPGVLESQKSALRVSDPRVSEHPYQGPTDAVGHT